MESYWDVIQQRCYMTQCAGFLARKDLKRLVQQLEDVQKMELGVEMTLSVQVLQTVCQLNFMYQVMKINLIHHS